MEPLLITPDKALEIILKHTPTLEKERIPLLASTGRVLGNDIVANISIPPFDNSAMDGYALHALDSRDATASSPVFLPIRGEIQAGGGLQAYPLEKGTAVRIMTGAPVPPSADSVIQFEDTEESEGSVKLFRRVAPGENIRRAGEDIRPGQRVLEIGVRLRAADVGLLASLNHQEIEAYRMPKVAIISTGDEIADPGEEMRPGQIRNSNAYTLMSEISRYAIPVYLGIARDNRDATRELFLKAMDCDAVITTGGVSMGRYDFVKDVMHDMGIEIFIENILMKPGKPCVFGKRKQTLFFGLPGNPVSTLVSFIQFVRPALLRLMGAARISKPVVKARLLEDIRKKAGRTHYIRGYFSLQNGEWHVTSTGPQGSGILRSMSEANCLIILPQEMTKAGMGDLVDIQLIHHDEI